MNHITRVFGAPFVAVVVLAATGCEMPPEERVELPEPPAGNITLLWTGSIRGELHPCQCPQTPYGGLARLASVIQVLRDTDPDALLIDLGDFTGDPIEGSEVEGAIARRERGWLTLESLGLMGYDALVPGERDLSLGAANLRRAADEAGVAILGTNLWLEAPAEPLGLTEIWRETQTGPVAFVAVTAPLGAEPLDAAAQGHERRLATVSPAAALRLALDGLEPRAAAVVILAHGPTEWARGLLAELGGRHLMVVAHDDEAHAAYEQVGESYLITTGSLGHRLGRLRITVNSEGGYGVGGAAIEVTEEYTDDPDVADRISELGERQQAAHDRLAEAAEGGPHPSGRDFVGFARCGKAGCHSDQVSAWYDSEHVSAYQSLQRINWHIEPECLECHTTGFGYAGGFVDRATTPTLAGVGCEACHGPGDDEEHHEEARAEVPEATCRSCHTEETDPSFNYEASLPLVRH